MQQYRYIGILFCMKLSPLSPLCQTEDTVLLAVLCALQHFTEIGLTIMLIGETSQCPNMSAPTPLESGTEATTQKQIEVKSS